MDLASSNSADTTFGEGPFSPHLDRINWAAVLLSEIFALLHGQVRWWLAFIALEFVVPAALRYLSFVSPAVRLAAVGFAVTGVHVAFGLQANRLLWDRAARQRRGETRLVANLPPSVARFQDWQRGWNWTAAVLLGGPLLCIVATSLDRLALLRGERVVILLVALLPILFGWGIDRRRARLTSASS